MNYDGQVLIDTSLGTDGLQQDLGKVSGKFGGLTKVLEKLGIKISQAMTKPVAGSLSQIKKDVNDCAKAIERYRAQIQKAQADKLPLEEQAKSMGAELDAAKAKLAELQAQQAAAQNALQLPEGRMAIGSEIDAYIDAQARLPQINAAVQQQQAQVDTLEKNWIGVWDKVDKYNLEITQANQLIKALEQKIAELADELKEAEKAAEGVRKKNKSASREMDKMGKTVRSFGSRLKSIVMGAFIFNGISAGLRELTSYFGSVLKTNQAFTAELSKLKGALLTAFQPIYNAVAPALTQLIRLLTSAVLAVAQFFAAISGTSLKDSAASAKNLYEEAKALDSVGSAAKKASKSMAGFDEINAMQDPADGGGAGSSGATEPDFSFGDWDEAAGKGIVDTIGLIVAAISGLSLGKFIADLLTANTKIDNMTDAIKLFGKKAKITAGVALTITGAFMETKGIIDALTNGLNTGSLFEIFGGGVSFTTGLSTTLGTILPKVTIMGKQIGGAALGAASGAILSGIPALITGIHDAAQNGLNWMNGSLVAASATAIGAGIGTLIPVIGPGVGALIGLVGGLITDAIFATGQIAKMQAANVLTEVEKELMAAASKAADAFQQQQKATQEAMSDKTAQMDYISSLADELFTLADASGTVTEKDRDRVNFILGELNSALGTEYTLVDNVIQEYDTLQTSIKDVIAAKTANALLEAGNADYIKAIQEEDAALDRARLAQKEYDAQLELSNEKYAKVVQLQKQLDEEKAKSYLERNNQLIASLESELAAAQLAHSGQKAILDEKKKDLDDAIADYDNYHTTILNYQAAQEAAYRGDYETAKDLLLKKEEDLSAYSDIVDKEVARNLAALEKAAIDAGIAAQNERENWEKGMDGFTEESVREAEEGYKAALAAYDNAYEDAYGKGRDVGTGLADSFEDSKKSVWQKAKELMAAAFNGMNSAGSSSGTAAAIASSAVSQSMYSLRSPTATPAIPQLARGAVLPANKPFMAVVGDQRHGTNVEAPLATIQEAVALVMADQMGGMMAGFNAVTERQERILQAIFGLDISDGALAAAVQRHQDKMATVTGGIA